MNQQVLNSLISDVPVFVPWELGKGFKETFYLDLGLETTGSVAFKSLWARSSAAANFDKVLFTSTLPPVVPPDPPIDVPAPSALFLLIIGLARIFANRHLAS